MTRILVVEDEQDLATLLVYNLRQAGYEAESAGSGASALVRLAVFDPHIVLLDLMLPDISGLDVLRGIRASPRYGKIPVVLLTARNSEADRIQGLELGADDYVAKPFSIREILLRIGAVLRRLEPADRPSGVLAAGPLRLDVARHEVTVHGRPVELTALEFRLLQTLLERRGRIQSRETLLADVWGIRVEVETRTVDTHIKRLRQKLGPAEALIETVRGVGYRVGEHP